MKVKVLRYFLYLDLELVGAFLEQLEGGKIQTTEKVSENRHNIQGGLNIALMQIGGGGNNATSHKETRTIYYDLYNRLEEALRAKRKLKDITKFEIKNKFNFHENQFILAYGPVTFTPEWSNWKSMGFILSKINDWLKQQQTSEQDQQIQGASQNNQLANGALKLILPNNNPVMLQSLASEVNPIPSLPDEPPEQIRALVKPERVNIELSYPEPQLKIKGTGILANFAEERMAELFNNKKVHTVYLMGLSSEIGKDFVDIIPMAIFVTI